MVVKYLGSKRTLVPTIAGLVDALPDVRTVCDLFTGTTRVAQELKRRGYFVVANDTATYSHQFAIAFIELDARLADVTRLLGLIDELNALPGARGYYTRTFCEEARYFKPKNGMRIDAIRDAIELIDLSPTDKAALLTSLIVAADRVDSTTGVQMAYLKSWAPRADNDLLMTMPKLIPGTGRASCMDAAEFVESGGTAGYDLTYLDPPYNQHSYFGNYHIWESLVRHDKPPTYGVAKKRLDTKQNRSLFNSLRNFRATFQRVVDGCQSRYLLVSFNNEGYLTEEELLAILRRKGHVEQVTVDYKRYVGAQIGIYNPAGRKVGVVSHLRNKEHLFLVGEQNAVREAASSAPGRTQLGLFG